MISRVPSQSRRAGLGSAPGLSGILVGMTCTVLSPAHATNNLPSGATVMSLGRSPTAMSRTRRLVSVSTTLMLRLPQLLTYRCRSSAPMAHECECWPTAIVASGASVSGSRTPISWLLSLQTYSLPVTGWTAMPDRKALVFSGYGWTDRSGAASPLAYLKAWMNQAAPPDTKKRPQFLLKTSPFNDWVSARNWDTFRFAMSSSFTPSLLNPSLTAT